MRNGRTADFARCFPHFLRELRKKRPICEKKKNDGRKGVSCKTYRRKILTRRSKSIDNEKNGCYNLFNFITKSDDEDCLCRAVSESRWQVWTGAEMQRFLPSEPDAWTANSVGYPVIATSVHRSYWTSKSGGGSPQFEWYRECII